MKYPRNDWLKEVKLYDSLFQDFHRESYDGISRCFGVVRKFRELLEQNFPNSEITRIQKTFAISRTMTRMRAVGRKYLSDREETLRARQSYISQVL